MRKEACKDSNVYYLELKKGNAIKSVHFPAAMLVVRVLRVARVARIFKLARYSTGLQTIGVIEGICTKRLLFPRRHYVEERKGIVNVDDVPGDWHHLLLDASLLPREGRSEYVGRVFINTGNSYDSSKCF